MRQLKIPPLIAVGAACMTAICASLGWLALSERRLSVASRVGISYSEGLTAIIAGWLFLAGALAIVGILAGFSRFKHLIWLALAVLWLSAVAVYFVWWY